MKLLASPHPLFPALIFLVLQGARAAVFADQAAPAAPEVSAVSGELPVVMESVTDSGSIVIFVRGAAGSAEYAPRFAAQESAWKKAAGRAGAAWRTVPGGEIRSADSKGQPPDATGGPDASAAAAPAAVEDGSGSVKSVGNDHALLEKILTEIGKSGSSAVWIVLAGHGTWDGREARFNLEGPDLSAGELAGWLKPLTRPVVVVNTSASSSPFVSILSGPGRIVISATRSGTERNYARFGEELAASLEDPAADYDEDGQVTLLELFLRASSRTAEFYLAEGRIQTEHALLEDNGDGKGTPASFFRGLRANVTAKDKAVPDGARSRLTALIPDAAARKMSPAQLSERDLLEGEIDTLRAVKSTMAEDDYYLKLEGILRRLAALELEAEIPAR